MALDIKDQISPAAGTLSPCTESAHAAYVQTGCESQDLHAEPGIG